MSDFNDYIRITLEGTNLPDGLIGDFIQLIACGESYEYILQSFNRTYYPVSEEDLAVVKRFYLSSTNSSRRNYYYHASR
jgi:hypothetical protein